MIQSIRLIAKEESFGALWKGHVPAQLLSVIYGTSQVCTQLSGEIKILYRVGLTTNFFNNIFFHSSFMCIW